MKIILRNADEHPLTLLMNNILHACSLVFTKRYFMEEIKVIHCKPQHCTGLKIRFDGLILYH